MSKPAIYVREYAVKREAVTAKRRVRYSDPKKSQYSPWGEVAQKRFWVEDCRVEVTIDIEEVCRALASRAIYAKSGKSSTFHGSIKAKVTKRVEHAVQVVEQPVREGLEVVA